MTIGTSTSKAITLENGAVFASSTLTTTISTRTLSWWVNVKTLQQTAGGFGISTASYDKFETIVWNERPSSEGWYFGSSLGARSGPVQAFASTSLNAWYMITAVYDTDYKMYVDDTLLFTIPNAGYLQTFSDPYKYLIGPRTLHNGAAHGYIDGSVGEAMVWGRALSLNEIKSLYKATFLTYKGIITIITITTVLLLSSLSSPLCHHSHYHFHHHHHYHHHY